VVQLQNDGAPGQVDEPGRPGRRLALTGGTVLRKTTDDGCADTGLGQLLAERRVRRVAVSGVLSEMCVSATARSALARGFGVVLPHDGHGTYDLEDVPVTWRTCRPRWWPGSPSTHWATSRSSSPRPPT
jgi:streptothricin hydrolase